MAVNRSDEERRAGDEARIARLYRIASAEEPPARIDAAIAAAARRAAVQPAQRRPAPWWNMWRVPFAVAAIAVVSVSLVTLMMEEGGERLTKMPESAPPVVVERDAVSRVEPASEGPAAPPEGLIRERRSESQASVPKRAAPPAERKDDTNAAGPVRREAAVAQEAQRGTGDTGAKTLQKAPLAEVPQTMAQESASTAAGALSAPRARLERETPDAFPAAADRAMPAAPAAAPKPAPAPRTSIGMRGLASESAEFARPSPEVARHIVQLDNQPPSMWIERITNLRKEGRLAEADGLLAEFKRRFPQEAIPALLQ